MSVFNPEVNESNRDPRVACALILDTSGSMHGAPMDQLNAGYEALRRSIDEDDLARKRTEILAITFSSEDAEITIPWTEGRDLSPTTFSAVGLTPLGAAVDLALDQVEARKEGYKAAGLAYYQPWVFVITDGVPTDPDAYDRATARLREAERRRAVTVFGVGVEGADMAVLAKLSERREPLKLAGLKFQELFVWLSQSMSQVSRSSAHGISDNDIVDGQVVGGEPEMLTLPSPSSWATW